MVPYRLTAGQYFAMIDADIFPRESRVELWDGMVYEKMAKTRSHDISAAKFIETLMPIKPRGWYLCLEASVTLDARRVPLPDVMLVRGQPEDYHEANPTGRDVGLVAELSLSSLKDDTGPKLAGYARASVPQYWVADLLGGLLMVYRDPIPAESRYATVETYRHGDRVPLWLDGVEIARVAVSDLLPIPRA